MQNNLHLSLKPRMNVILILVYLSVACWAFSQIQPFPLTMLSLGIAMGMIGGLLQKRAFKEAMGTLQKCKSAIEVRNVLKSTKSGKAYLYLLWTGVGIISLFSFKMSNQPLPLIVLGYCSMALIRELVTLPSIIVLSRV